MVKLLKDRNFWISAALAGGFCAGIYPYYHDMYIPAAFTVLCAGLNFATAFLLGALLHGWLWGKDYGSTCLWPLAVTAMGHGVFSVMSWGSWVCLGLTAMIFLAYGWRAVSKRPRLRKILLRVLAVLLLVLLCLGVNPRFRAELLVGLYRPKLEKRIQTAVVEGDLDNVKLPNYIWVRKTAAWQGEHTMVEFYLSTGWLAGYSGCYYSFDDVPLTFQNTRAELIPQGPDQWSWQGEGDSRGKTVKITDHWYYFEASF